MRDTLLEKVVHWSVGALGTAIGGWLAKQHNPLYYPGRMEEHVGWLFLPLVVALIALALSISNLGFAIVSSLAILGAVGFGILYGNEAFQNGGWPLVTWVLHLVELALLVGIVAGIASRLALFVKRHL